MVLIHRVLILLLDVLSPITTDICNGIFPEIDHSLHQSSPFLVQLSFLSFTMSQTFSQIGFCAMIGTLHWNYRYSLCITIGLTIYIGASFLCSLSKTAWLFAVSRFLQGLGAGFAVPINHELSRSFYPALTSYFRFRALSKLHRQRTGANDQSERPHRETTPYGARDHHAYSSVVSRMMEEEDVSTPWTTFSIFIVMVIRSVIGIAGAAPIGAVITSQTSWQHVFGILAFCGLLTAFLFLPLFCSKRCRFEIEKQGIDLLGILGFDALMVRGDQLQIDGIDHQGIDQKEDVPLAQDHVHRGPDTGKKSKISVFVIGSPQSVDSPPTTMINSQSPASSKQRVSQTVKTKRLSEVDNVSSLLSEQTALSAVSFMSDPLHDPLHSVATLHRRRRTTNLSIGPRSVGARSVGPPLHGTGPLNIITDLDEGSNAFFKEFGSSSKRILCSNPQNLSLLIMLSAGYCGVLFILSEIAFALNGDIMIKGLIIGGMVLSLMMGSVICGYFGERAWTFLFILCAVFGGISLIATMPMFNCKEAFTECLNVRIHSDWTYGAVFCYLFFFGNLGPIIITLLAENTNCSLSIVLQIIHFWRTAVSVIVVAVVLANRECIGSDHRNFLHLVLAVCSVIIFGVGFAVIGPLRCCVHSRSMYGDHRLLTNIENQ